MVPLVPLVAQMVGLGYATNVTGVPATALVAETVNDSPTLRGGNIMSKVYGCAAFATVSVKVCVAFVPIPLAAVIAIGYTPAQPEAGVPESTPVDESVTPEGSGPGVL